MAGTRLVLRRAFGPPGAGDENRGFYSSTRQNFRRLGLSSDPVNRCHSITCSRSLERLWNRGPHEINNLASRKYYT